MAFIANFFGFGDSSKDKAEEQKNRDEKEKENHLLAVKTINESIIKLENSMEDQNKDILKLEADIRSLIMNKQKQKAAVLIKKVKLKKSRLATLSKQTMTLHNQLVNLENQSDDSEFFHALKVANKVNQARQERQDEYLDVLTQAKEIQNDIKLHQQRIDELLEIDEEEAEEIDQLYAEYAIQFGLQDPTPSQKQPISVKPKEVTPSQPTATKQRANLDS